MNDPIKLGLAAWYDESATYELPYSDDEKASMRRALAAWCEARAKELVSGSFGVGDANYAARLEDDAAELREGR